MTEQANDRVCVAQIGAPHGVRGEVRLWPFTTYPMALRDYGLLETEDGGRGFEIETLRPAKDHLVARLRGIADRDAAERLRNIKLFVPRSRLPAPEADEFYHADLIGLPVFDTSNQQLGTVAAVHNFGAGDLLEVQRTGGSSVLLTFTQAVVPMVDLAAGRIVIRPPAGTFEQEEPDLPSSPAAVRGRSAAKRPRGG